MDLDQFKEKLMGAILNILGAPADMKAQYEFMTNPPTKQTMSVLTPSQVTFVTLAKWSAIDEPVAFKFFDTWADQLLLTAISKDGGGRQDIIKYEQSKRAAPQSNVNVISALKDQVNKIKDKPEGNAKA